MQNSQSVGLCLLSKFCFVFQVFKEVVEAEVVVIEVEEAEVVVEAEEEVVVEEVCNIYCNQSAL